MCEFCYMGEMADVMWHSGNIREAVQAETFGEVLTEIRDEAQAAVGDEMKLHELRVAACMIRRAYADAYGQEKVFQS